MHTWVETMLKIRNLTAGYGELTVLHRVSFDVKPGDFVALIGPNGAGKSTILKSIFSLCGIQQGKITFNKEDITYLPTHELIAKGVSFVPQGRLVFSDLTVHENLEMGAYTLQDKTLIKKRIAQLYRQFPILKKKRNDYAFSLSGGQQQLLAIARALMQDPKLLLLDEPSLGLSPKAMKEVFGMIKKLNEKAIAILMVEQNVKQAVQHAKKTIVLEDGAIKLTGGKDVLKNKRLKDIYFGGDAG